jgi:hypothetical protein
MVLFGSNDATEIIYSDNENEPIDVTQIQNRAAKSTQIDYNYLRKNLKTIKNK